MEEPRELITEFLSHSRIAVAGVSEGRQTPANAIYAKLKQAGHRVSAVSPTAKMIEGDPCYPELSAIEPRPDGVVLVTRPEVSAALIDECIRLGIPRVWIHNLFGTVECAPPGSLSSVDLEAVRRGREAGLKIISGSCPMQFVPPVDPFHRCVRWLSTKAGRL